MLKVLTVILKSFGKLYWCTHSLFAHLYLVESIPIPAPCRRRRASFNRNDFVYVSARPIFSAAQARARERERSEKKWHRRKHIAEEERNGASAETDSLFWGVRAAMSRIASSAVDMHLPLCRRRAGGGRNETKQNKEMRYSLFHRVMSIKDSQKHASSFCFIQDDHFVYSARGFSARRPLPANSVRLEIQNVGDKRFDCKHCTNILDRSPLLLRFCSLSGVICVVDCDFVAFSRGEEFALRHSSASLTSPSCAELFGGAASPPERLLTNRPFVCVSEALCARSLKFRSARLGRRSLSPDSTVQFDCACVRVVSHITRSPAASLLLENRLAAVLFATATAAGCSSAHQRLPPPEPSHPPHTPLH